MKYRPSKSFIRSMVLLCPLLGALCFSLLPELDKWGQVYRIHILTGMPSLCRSGF